MPANIATFRIEADSKLSFANSYEIATGSETQFWSGMVTVGQSSSPALNCHRPA